MNKPSIKNKLSLLSIPVIASTLLVPAAIASADIRNASTTTDSQTQNTQNQTGTNSQTNTPQTKTDSKTSTDSQTIANIISKGNEEIDRRINNLNKLTSLIDSSTKLTSAEKTTLTDDINTTISGLNTLKTQLDSATTLTDAINDVKSIYTEYRVYALLDPKIHLIKVSDDQQAIEAKLTDLSSKLQTRITDAQNAGQDVSVLNSDLANMNGLINSAENISSSVETAVINLQPTDYNSNHSVLEGYNTQLKTAREDIKSALMQAKTIISTLEASNSSTSNSSSTGTN